MYGNKLAIDDAGQRQQVKGIHEHLIGLLVVLVKTFIFEIEEGC